MSERPDPALEPEPPETDGPELDPASSGDDDVETNTDPAADHMVPSE
jgi:hypothetical protein